MMPSKESINDFISECEEIFERLTISLTRIEREDTTDNSLVDSIYRDIHTIKGASQLFGYSQMGQIAHSMETCLEPVREGLIKLNRLQIDAIFECIDAISSILKNVQSSHKEGNHASILNEVIPQLMLAFHDEKKSNKSHSENSNQKGGTATTEFTEVAHETVNTIRVQVPLLENLISQVSELVLIRNQLLQFSNESDDHLFLQLSQRLNQVTSKLQNDVMKTRMQSVSTVTSKLHRIVRDLSRELNRKVILKTEGDDTELDKNLIEAVKDPLNHIIRNAMDHGIEPSAERLKAGKSGTGTIFIRSSQEGGHVIISITDDGRGMNAEKIASKALEKNLITADKLSCLTEKEILGLIFLPGFSTADKITRISGRGVGMDVVKTNIEKIGGVVELSSENGGGSTVHLKIPLTLAIVPVLLVKANNERFAIPQVKLVELVQLGHESQSKIKIEFLEGNPFFRLRGKLLPLISLPNLISEKPKNSIEIQNELEHQKILSIAVLISDGHQIGLIVDEILDAAVIVVKPLAQFLKNCSFFAGATIMGEGTVALILDITKIISSTHFAQISDAELKLKNNSFESSELKENVIEYLLVEVAGRENYALPVWIIRRLEEFHSQKVTLSGNQKLVKYRDSLLPIIPVAEILNLSSLNSQDDDKTYATESESQIKTIVIERKNLLYALEVDSIIDIIEANSDMDDSTIVHSAIMGTIIVDKKVISVIDANAIIDGFTSKQCGAVVQDNKMHTRKNFHILVADDSAFYRKQIERALSEAGFKTTVVEDGRRALQTLESLHSSPFSLVLSDIEMPYLNGFELARSIRNLQNREIKNIPLMALSTKASENDMRRGASVGFNDYVEKFNPEILVARIDKLLNNI